MAPPVSRDILNQETNARYWTQSGYKPGQPLDPNDPLDQAQMPVWMAIFRTVSAENAAGTLVTTFDRPEVAQPLADAEIASKVEAVHVDAGASELDPAVAQQHVAAAVTAAQVVFQKLREAAAHQPPAQVQEPGPGPAAAAPPREALITETNHRFWGRTQYKPGQRLDMKLPEDRRQSKVWLEIFGEVQREASAGQLTFTSPEQVPARPPSQSPRERPPQQSGPRPPQQSARPPMQSPPRVPRPPQQSGPRPPQPSGPLPGQAPPSGPPPGFGGPPWQPSGPPPGFGGPPWQPSGPLPPGAGMPMMPRPAPAPGMQSPWLPPPGMQLPRPSMLGPGGSPAGGMPGMPGSMQQPMPGMPGMPGSMQQPMPSMQPMPEPQQPPVVDDLSPSADVLPSYVDALPDPGEAGALVVTSPPAAGMTTGAKIALALIGLGGLVGVVYAVTRDSSDRPSYGAGQARPRARGRASARVAFDAPSPLLTRGGRF